MASTIKVNTLDTQTGTELALAATKKITGDNTQFKITGGASTNVLTTDGSGALTWGAIAAGFTGVHTDVTSGSEIYTVPTGVTKLLVIITGAGGGGAAGETAIGNCGVGGAGGTTVMARVTVVAADTITIAIGAGGSGGASASAIGVVGGDSTFTHASGSGTGLMSTITAPGGRPGKHEAATDALVAGTVGANNEGISILGGYGSIGYSHPSGNGGPTFWGGGGQGALNGDQVSVAGTAYGSGGGGGTNSGVYIVGAAGAVGVCFILEFK